MATCGNFFRLELTILSFKPEIRDASGCMRQIFPAWTDFSLFQAGNKRCKWLHVAIFSGLD